mmetsp:Transcript_3378/g.7952  ORF Transcript_3378/g.7952 Transcript_3378/m.7952 type:complete len:460 (-) Transcript_3378:83-1462(-)
MDSSRALVRAEDDDGSGQVLLTPRDDRRFSAGPTLPSTARSGGSRVAWVGGALLATAFCLGLVNVATHGRFFSSSAAGSVMLAADLDSGKASGSAAPRIVGQTVGDAPMDKKKAKQKALDTALSDKADKSDKTDKAKADKGTLRGSSLSKVSSNKTGTEHCETAEPGSECYDSVLWTKWVGLVENPQWYSGLYRNASRFAIQAFLNKTQKAKCPKPCGDVLGSGPAKYPVPKRGKEKNHPSVFCFSVARLGSEMDTMLMQRQSGSGIFSCDGYAVFSDADYDLDGIRTSKISSTVAGVSVDKTAANSQVFMRTWLTLLDGNQWWKYDFIAKVDPDAILFADRMRGHLAANTGQDVFFLNCNKYIPETMYGALEVFSKQALGVYKSEHGRCEKALPFAAWGEDRYMANCLEMLGVRTQADETNFLHDERCWGVDCGNHKAVAFHSFKHVNTWYRCWQKSK